MDGTAAAFRHAVEHPFVLVDRDIADDFELLGEHEEQRLRGGESFAPELAVRFDTTDGGPVGRHAHRIGGGIARHRHDVFAIERFDVLRTPALDDVPIAHAAHYTVPRM